MPLISADPSLDHGKAFDSSDFHTPDDTHGHGLDPKGRGVPGRGHAAAGRTVDIVGGVTVAVSAEGSGPARAGGRG